MWEGSQGFRFCRDWFLLILCKSEFKKKKNLVGRFLLISKHENFYEALGNRIETKMGWMQYFILSFWKNLFLSKLSVSYILFCMDSCNSVVFSLCFCKDLSKLWYILHVKLYLVSEMWLTNFYNWVCQNCDI